MIKNDKVDIEVGIVLFNSTCKIVLNFTVNCLLENSPLETHLTYVHAFK
jgi:hypothetical protein